MSNHEWPSKAWPLPKSAWSWLKYAIQGACQQDFLFFIELFISFLMFSCYLFNKNTVYLGTGAFCKSSLTLFCGPWNYSTPSLDCCSPPYNISRVTPVKSSIKSPPSSSSEPHTGQSFDTFVPCHNSLSIGGATGSSSVFQRSSSAAI